MARKSNPYHGSILGKSWEVPDFGEDNPYKTEEQRRQASQEHLHYIRTGLLERLAELYKHFGIQPKQEGADFQLLMKLAERHVPGFQIAKLNQRKRGRPAKWKGEAGVRLYVDVQLLVQREGTSVLGACKHLVKQPEYRNMSPETLHSRYQEFKKIEGSMKDVALIVESVSLRMLDERDHKRNSTKMKNALSV